MNLLLRNNIKLDYTSEIHLLEVRWMGALVKKEFTLLWQQVIAYSQQHPVHFILLDATQVDTQGSPGMEDKEIQQLLKQPLPIPSLKKVARVTTGNRKYDQKMSGLYTSLQQQHPHFAFQNFSHYYQALDWLLGISWSKDHLSDE